MAFVERYVRSDAAGGNDGTQEAQGGGTTGPWTLAEGFAHTEGVGVRVNIQSDAAYSIGTTTIAQAGSAVSLSVYRGYNTAIGDLEGQGRNADGTLDTTNFPVITLTGSLLQKQFMVLESLSLTGALSANLIASSLVDIFSMVSCSIINTQSHGSAACFLGDNYNSFINCDFECSGASHGQVVDTDLNVFVSGCRFKGVANATLLGFRDGHVSSSVFIGNNTGIGLYFTTTVGSSVEWCTFYNLGTAMNIVNAATNNPHRLLNNHATDCGKWLDNLYSGTANNVVIEINNRTRDNTVPRTGIGDGVNIGEITTDTGGIATDYVDAGAGNFRLIAAAPGKAAGLIAYQDCGAYQREEPEPPAVGDVEAGVQYGQGGTEFTGTFVVPLEADVESGVDYGEAAEFTGTLDVGNTAYLIGGGLVHP